VTAGYSFGLPVGVSFMGRAFSEPMLIKIASGFEATVNARRVPTFEPTIGTDATPKARGRAGLGRFMAPRSHRLYGL
jgi:hypothetical protein